MTYHFLRKSYLADLKKTYQNLTTNFGKILGSFENRAPAPAQGSVAHHLYTDTITYIGETRASGCALRLTVD